MSQHIIEATDANFDALALGPGLHLVDFWAPWCGPCKAMAPTLSDVADDFAAELRVVKLDVEAHKAVAERFQVRAIPLLVLFRDGQEVTRHAGMATRSRLTAMIEAGL